MTSVKGGGMRQWKRRRDETSVGVADRGGGGARMSPIGVGEDELRGTWMTCVAGGCRARPAPQPWVPDRGPARRHFAMGRPQETPVQVVGVRL